MRLKSESKPLPKNVRTAIDYFQHACRPRGFEIISNGKSILSPSTEGFQNWILDNMDVIELQTYAISKELKSLVDESLEGFTPDQYDCYYTAIMCAILNNKIDYVDFGEKVCLLKNKVVFSHRKAFGVR